MKARDRNEEETKEGCGRVVLYKEFSIIHSYTIECGYHLNAYNNSLKPPTNTHSHFLVRYHINERGEKIYDPTEKSITEEKYNKLKEEGKEIPKNSDMFQYISHSLDDP